jgi:hypothetical protein
MKLILVNFTSTYHRLVAREIIRRGAEVTRIYCIPDYKDPKGSIEDRENSHKNHYREDPEFVSTEIVDLRELQFADRMIRAFASSENSLSEDFLQRMSECEITFMRQSDRFSFYPVSASVRRRIYQALLCHCLDVFTTCRPDRIIFADSPHVGFDTVLYFVARDMRIETLFVERTHINNASLLISDYLCKPSIPQDFLSQLSPEALIQKFQRSKFANALESASESRSLESIKKKHIQLETAEAQVDRSVKRFRLAVKRIRRGARRIIGHSRFRKNRYSRAMVFNSIRSIEEIAKAHHEYARHKDALRTIYNRRSTADPDLKKPFVFFPLHMQPEKTTSAFGGYFEDQYLAIKIISDSLPKDYTIYVKEHPAQLVSGRLENMLYRDEAYYDLICRIPKVVLLSMGCSYQDLMSRSCFNATITGSVGWESMLQGKPVLIFGNSWYAECSACFQVSSVEECRKAFSRMREMRSEEVQIALMKYILYYERFFVPFAANPRHVVEFDLSYEEQIRAFAQAASGTHL